MGLGWDEKVLDYQPGMSWWGVWTARGSRAPRRTLIIQQGWHIQRCRQPARHIAGWGWRWRGAAVTCLHPPRRGGLPRELPHGGRSLCGAASHELWPFASANGPHIASGKRAQNPYGGRPANELRVPRALLLLWFCQTGRSRRKPRALPVPAWGFSYQSLPFLASQDIPFSLPIRPNQLRKEGQLPWSKSPSSPSPRGWGVGIRNMMWLTYRNRHLLEERERCPPPSGTLTYPFTSHATSQFDSSN